MGSIKGAWSWWISFYIKLKMVVFALLIIPTGLTPFRTEFPAFGGINGLHFGRALI